MPSETDIANQALIMVGAQPINSLNDTSNQALSCKVLYYPARDGLLREIPWNFARTQVALNQLANVPLNLDLLPNNHGPGYIQYTGAFAVPKDFLRLYRFSPEDTHWRIVSFNVGSGENQLAILTDAIPGPDTENVLILGTQPPNADGDDDLPGGVSFVPATTALGMEYIARVTNPDRFDPLFVECLAAKLASQIAFSQTAVSGIAQQMLAIYKDRLADAAAVNGMENWPDALYDNTVVNVRYGWGYGGGWGWGY